MQRSYLEDNRRYESVAGRKFLVEEELEVGLWRLNVWFEDFMCTVVQWYLECDGYSSRVKIRCQETYRNNFAEE
jgi:hypothetical protein